MSTLSEQLKNLPVAEPPAGGWNALLQRQRHVRHRRQGMVAGFAVAASLLLTAGLLLWQPPPASEAPAPLELAQLMERSRQLEQTLAAVRPQAQRWDRSLARTAAGLQDELAVVDLQLNYAEDAGAERLWQNRVELMSQLVQTHQQAAARPTAGSNPSGNNEEYAI